MKKNKYKRIRDGIKAVRFCKWFSDSAITNFSDVEDADILIELSLRKLSKLGYVSNVEKEDGTYWVINKEEK